MYYRKLGTSKWFRVTRQEFQALGMRFSREQNCYLNPQGFQIQIKCEPDKNPKQRRQQSIASMMRSATCIQAQLKFIQSELSKIDLSDLDDNEATRVAKVYDNISRSKVVRTKEEANKLVESLKLLNKYVTLANKESRTPLTQ